MTDDLKKLAEAVKAATAAYIANPTDRETGRQWDRACAEFSLACTEDAILNLIRERDEARAELALYQGDPAGITKVPDHIANHAKQLSASLLDERKRREAAEAALSAAQDEVERLREALHKLETAASSMLIGVGVHNDRHIARGGSRIEGPVVTALVHATRNAGEVLKEPATLTKEPTDA